MKKILLVLFFISTAAFAWEPIKPITVTIGYSAGSNNEIAFKKAAEVVTKNNPKVVFVVEIKPGASGIIANNHVVAQLPDGYNIGVPSTTTTVIANNIWQSDLQKYEWDKFVTPVVLGETAMALISSSTSSVSNLPEFISLLKNPSRNINVATAGGTQALSYYYLLDIAQTNKTAAEEIRYGSSSAVALAVASNQVEFGITAFGIADKLAKDQRLKILAVTSSPDFYITNGYMIILPPGTPANIVKWYETEFGRAIHSPEFQAWASANYFNVNTSLSTNRAVKTYLNSLKSKFSKVMTVIKSNKE
jgi:tripartite-type tricarboxylate transporter receptor subunit TctC